MEYVILVDELDNAIGKMEKQQAHKEGALHRAFSIFIFNSEKKLLLQKRAIDKYHCGGLWTNTCCSHPREDETILDAANRRLQEEMGLKCVLKKEFSFVYNAALENGLTEYEFDHVLLGETDDQPTINEEEVSEFRFVQLNDLQIEISKSPEIFTPWFLLALNKVLELKTIQS